MGYVVIIGITIIFLIILIIIILKNLKGKIQIITTKDEFLHGETIDGEIKIKAKKDIESKKLVVTLACDETMYNVDTESSTNSRTRRIYEENKILETDKEYPAGTEQTYKFTLNLPEQEKGPETKTGKVLKKIGKLMSSNKKIERKIEARLYAKGLDLTSNKKIKLQES